MIDKLYCRLPFSYIGILNRELSDVKSKSILDVGCGSGKTFMRLKQLTPVSYSVGLDIHAPYIEQAKIKNTYDDYILAKASPLPFNDKSFDVIISLQLIEHMEKEEALIAIREMERVAKRKVIIATPRGSYPQEEFDGNPYQTHKSTWDIDEMESLGYRVVPCGTRLIKYTGTFLNKLISYLISVVGLVFLPYKTAGGMICVKEIS